MAIREEKIFRDSLTLHYSDKRIQSQYMKDKYISYRLLICVLIYFSGFVTLLGLSIKLRFDDIQSQSKERIDVIQIVFLGIMSFISLLLTVTIVISKPNNVILNILNSICLNFLLFLFFESIKIIVFHMTNVKFNVFIISIIEFSMKGVFILFIDDNFILNFITFGGFLPLYLIEFTKKYEFIDNEREFYIIIFSFLCFGSYFLERINKYSYFSKLTYFREVDRSSNLIDNMKSGFITINLSSGLTKLNKIAKERIVSRLVEGVGLDKFTSLVLEGYDNESNAISNEKNKEKEKEKKRNSIKNFFSKSPNSNEIIDISMLPIKELMLIENNLIKNVLFTRLEKVNSYGFDGELKKESEEINTKVNISNVKSEKSKFFNKRRSKSNLDNEAKEDKAEAYLNEDKSVFNKSELPLIKGKSGVNLLPNQDFEGIIKILTDNNSLLFDFQYLACKKALNNDTENEYSCQIYVRYDEYENNLEFILNEIVSFSQTQVNNSRIINCNSQLKSNKILSAVNINMDSNRNCRQLVNEAEDLKIKVQSQVQISPFKSKIKKNLTYNRHNPKNTYKIIKSYIEKMNLIIKFPLKELSNRLKDVNDQIDNSDEVTNEIKKTVKYMDNIITIINFSIEDFKIFHKKKLSEGRIFKEKIDVTDFIDGLFLVCQSKCRLLGKNIRFTYEIGKYIDDSIVTDSKLLRHILINLLSNSITASQNGSIVHIKIDYKSNKRKEFINFSIFDEGSSMTKDQVEYYNRLDVFDEEARKENEKNRLGGILVCKKILDVIGLGKDLVYEIIIPKGLKVSFQVKVYSGNEINDDPQLTSDEEDEDENEEKGENHEEDNELSLNSINENNENDNQIELPLIKNKNNNQAKENKQILKKSLIFESNFLKNNRTANDYPSFKRFSVALNKEVIDNFDFRIIIADDDQLLRDSIKQSLDLLFSQYNKRVDFVECSDGAELIYALYSHFVYDKCVDALVFDENMQFITGGVLVDMLNILMKRSIIPELPIFITTEYEIKGSQSQFKNLKYILKPIEFAVMKKNFSLFFEERK